MYDAGKIVPGLIVFVAIATFPFLYNQGRAAKPPQLKLDTPAIQALGDNKKCVESKEFMRAEHMKMLNQWRDTVVRDGKRLYVSSTGKEWDMSLQNGCLKCHSNKKQFCDQCHNYMGLTPYCFTCHLEPKEGAKPIVLEVPAAPAATEGAAATDEGTAPAAQAPAAAEETAHE